MPFLIAPQPCLAGLACAWCCTIAVAQLESPAALPALEQCAQIGAPADRLRCYDKLAGRATEPPTPAATPPADNAAPASTTQLLPTTPSPPRTEPAGSGSLLSKYWELDRADKRGVFNFIGYRANYVLPVHWTSHINRSPQSPTHAAVTTPDYRHLEAKIQLSLRTKVVQSLILPDSDLWFGFTQQSLWQVYNRAGSGPFRNTDYEPEAIYIVPTPRPLRQLPSGWQWRYTQLGVAHQSNGQADPLSRSWNRVYLGAGFERGDMSLIARVLRRMRENPASDDNPDITDYRGRAEVQLNWTPGAATASVLYRNTLKNAGRGALQAEFTYPVRSDQPNGLRWYLQLFSGFGETLTDYNFRQTSVGAGLTFLQF
jgi:phospholipase A1